MKKVPYKAVGSNVIVQVIKKEKTKGGLYLPKEVAENRKQAAGDTHISFKVVDIGKDGPDTIKVGDYIFYKNSYAAVLPKLEGEDREFVVVEYKGIMAIRDDVLEEDV